MNYELTDIEHDGPIAAKRITWDNGKTWDVLVEVPWGVRSKIRASVGGLVKIDGSTFTPDRSNTAGMLQAIEEANMQRLVGCTVGWSWDIKVTRASVEAMSPRYVGDVLNVMRELQDAEDDAGEKKSSPSQFSTELLSGVNGRSPVNTSQGSSLE